MSPHVWSTFTGDRKPLNRVSQKRLSQLDQRAAVRRLVHERDGERCRLNPRSAFYPHGAPTYDIGPCDGPLDVHEPFSRGRGGSHLDPDNAVLLCRSHHSFVHDHPREAADLGLLIPSRGYE